MGVGARRQAAASAGLPLTEPCALSPQMAIVFNQEGLKAIQPPCVVQNFINHNAVLYKVFVVGEAYTVVQRPSLKNFSAGTSGNCPRAPSLVEVGRQGVAGSCPEGGLRYCVPGLQVMRPVLAPGKGLVSCTQKPVGAQWGSFP